MSKVKLQASRCVNQGLETSVKLKISNKNEIAKYLRDSKFLTSIAMGQVKAKELPWTNIQIFDGVPEKAYLRNKARTGSIRIRLLGNVPEDLVLCLSE